MPRQLGSDPLPDPLDDSGMYRYGKCERCGGKTILAPFSDLCYDCYVESGADSDARRST